MPADARRGRQGPAPGPRTSVYKIRVRLGAAGWGWVCPPCGQVEIGFRTWNLAMLSMNNHLRLTCLDLQLINLAEERSCGR